MTEEPQPNAVVAGDPAVVPAPAPGPVPRPQKPRLLHDGRDMFWSLIPLVVGCAVLAGLLGMCSFALGSNKGAIPSFDATRALRADAATLGFPIRQPQLPTGWQANSGHRGAIQGGRTDPATGQRHDALTSVVGYITPAGMYLSLTQSNADEDKLVGSIHSSAYPTATVDIAGTSWVVYQGSGQSGAETEPIWTTRLSGPTGASQIAVTGAGSADEFRTLASATQTQPPLPARAS